MTINRYTVIALLGAAMIILGAMIVDGSSYGIEIKNSIGFITGITAAAVGGGVIATAITLEANRD